MEYYTATLYPAKEGGYTACFKDFPEALTQGEDMQETIKNAHEALALTIEEYAVAGRKLPPPSGADVYLWSLEHNPTGMTMDGVMLVAVPGPGESQVRVSISFAKSTLAAIDQKAAALGMTRSGYLSAVGLGYIPESGKSPGAQLDELGRKHGLSRKPTERYTDFVGRIFEEWDREKAHA